MNQKNKNKYGAAIVCAVMVAFFFVGCGAKTGPLGTDATAPPAARINLSTLSGAPAIADVAEYASPAVVGIASVKKTKEYIIDGVGTGFFVSSDGYILTNHHVAAGTSQLTAITRDGAKIDVSLVWADKALDLAVLKAEGGPYPHLGAAGEEAMRVGEGVVAIGTPLALMFQHTVTSGIISALERTILIEGEQEDSFLEGLIQSDAAINPGNSGGPLLNMQGEVIGINTVKITQAEGIGFAVPVDIAMIVVDKLVTERFFETPYAGIFAVDKKIAAFYDGTLELGSGIYVINVDMLGPAGGSGLEIGDVILTCNGEAVNNMLDLRRAMYRAGVGETLILSGQKVGGEPFDIAVTLSRAPY